ncbi:class I SAM-dependent methyltransferase [uncultured Fibrobacter sp.]|uniref:class I SAM-dependent methyltransferase n=1 Tax=uncultured Fibrobacter sp. TaxID=261512 RepID=UPI0025D3AE04|nr:class I SAM-dependent methyltransferase [uncultured Fibrobacter sp.]
MKSPVRKMFDGIASRYDFLNHFLSCYQDVLWRRYCCKRLKKMMAAGMLAEKSIDEMPLSKLQDETPRGLNKVRLLDLCGGTGDFANTFRKVFESGCKCGCACKCVSQNGASRDFIVDPAVIGDFSYGMLAEVKPKKIDAHAVQLDAMKMPFAERQFDVILNGFGMRNVPDARGALLESYRVLDEGGFLCVLEFFSPRNLFNKFFYKVLAPLFIPVMGAFFSGKRDAYEYLVNSIIRFLPVDQFCKMAEECGFEVKQVKMFDGGISFGVFLHKPGKA